MYVRPVRPLNDILTWEGTRLQDQNADLKAELRTLKTAQKVEPPPASPIPAPLISYGFRRQTTSPQPPSENQTVAQLRQEFSVAQQERADLLTQVALLRTDLEQSRAKVDAHDAHIGRLTHQNARLSIRVKDREEELRGKAKLLENVQDDFATLNLELNQAEQEVKKVKKENKELVDRWVAKMGQEADKMNEQSKFT